MSSNGDYICGECGSTDTEQVVTQREVVHADENGEPETIDILETHVDYVECGDCGEKIIG